MSGHQGHQAVRWRRPALLPGLLLLLALAALPWLTPVLAAHAHREYERGIIELAAQQFDRFYLVAAVVALALGLYAVLIAPHRWPLALLLVAATQAAMLWGFAAPAFAGAYQAPTRDAALRARELGLPAVMFHTYLPSFSVYRGAPTPQGKPQPGELVLVRADRLGELQRALPEEARLSTEFKMGGIILLLRQPDGSR